MRKLGESENTMRKIDLFKADRTMSGRVEEYVKCRVLRKAISKDYSDKIQSIDLSIKNLDNLRGSILESTIATQKEELMMARMTLVAERAEQLKKEATFEFTKADKDFKKALKGVSMDSPVIAEQVVEWFKNYGLDVSDSELLADICQAIGGKEDFHKLVDADGMDGISVDNNRALSMLYWVAFRHMATVGTIKPAQIPAIIKDNFGTAAQDAKKKAKKEAKKATKAEKKAEAKVA